MKCAWPLFLKQQHCLLYSKAQVALVLIFPGNDLSSPPLHCEEELLFTIGTPLAIIKPL